MDAYLLDWANLLLRWLHVITAIAWVGSSFYFVWLDNHLIRPKSPDLLEKGVDGALWAVHGGGFYNPQKYMLAPKKIHTELHWFYWESYSTWLSGFALFTVLYLWNAGTFLIDKSVYAWTPAGAVVAALAFLVVFWLVYDVICRTLGQRENGDKIVGVAVALAIVLASYLACQLFAGRAAFLLVGAMIATAMSANVFFLIIPGQRKVVAAMTGGQPVDPIHGQRGKQRSVHNTYFTLPVLVAMLSNHYGWLYQGPHNWIVLVLMMVAGALDPALLRCPPQGAREGRAAALGLCRRRHGLDPGPGGLAGAGAAARGQHGAGEFCAGAGGGAAALRAVPQRPGAAEERGAAHARADQATCPGRLPAGGGAEADADEQRHADHRRRA